MSSNGNALGKGCYVGGEEQENERSSTWPKESKSHKRRFSAPFDLRLHRERPKYGSRKKPSSLGQLQSFGRSQREDNAVINIGCWASKHPPENDQMPRVVPTVQQSSSNALQPAMTTRSTLEPAQVHMKTRNINPDPSKFSTNLSELRTLVEREIDMTTAFDNGLRRIQRQRENNWSLLLQIHDIRARLRVKQRAKSSADDALFQRMRGEQLLGPNYEARHQANPPKTLSELMQECESIRDEYGPLEDDCNMLEDRLSTEEFKLSKMEMEWFRQSIETAIPRPANVSAESSEAENDRESEASVSDAIDTFDFHPLVIDFLSRLGDLDLLQERLEDLLIDKDVVVEQKETRRRVGMDLDIEGQRTLENFDAAYEKLLADIIATEQDVGVMRKGCLARGLIDEHDEPTNLESQEGIHFSGEQELDPEDNISEYVKYPLLLPRPGIRQEVEEIKPEPDGASDKTSKRINQWLLEQLRTSPLEVVLLASTFEKQWGKTNEEWEFCVLAVWFTDETRKATTNTHAWSTSGITSTTYPDSHRASDYQF